MLRTARPEEAPLIRSMVEHTYEESDHYNDYYFSMFWRPENTFVYEEDGIICACVQAHETRLRYGEAVAPAVMDFSAAVLDSHRGKGLAQAVLLYSKECMTKRGHTFRMCFTNLNAHKPWQSIGYVPAFPMHFRMVRKSREASGVKDVRRVSLEDVWLIPQLNAMYNSKFAHYARIDRSPQDWLHILCEYTVDGGGVFVLWDGGTPIGYAVYNGMADGEPMQILEYACADPHIEAALLDGAMELTGTRCAVCHEPMTYDNADLCVATGVVQRLAPGGIPDFPYEAGYLNLLHK